MKNTIKTRGTRVQNSCRLTDSDKGRLETFIRNNVGEKLRLFDLCTLIGTCESGLIRKVKAAYALTPHCLIELIRIERACELLQGSQLSIAEVAYATGFTHQSRFGQVFRKYMKMTPSEYRGEYQAMQRPSNTFITHQANLYHYR